MAARLLLAEISLHFKRSAAGGGEADPVMSKNQSTQIVFFREAWAAVAVDGHPCWHFPQTEAKYEGS